MKKVSIALLFLALLLVVVGAQWRRAVGPEPIRAVPFSIPAGQAARLSSPLGAHAGTPARAHRPADVLEKPKPISLPLITLPAGCGTGCNALTHRTARVI
jgi:hypothetical protein